MFIVNVNIKIGELELDFISTGKIVSSWKNLTDTATIVLPRKVTIIEGYEKKPLQDVIKKGDEVEIQLGYDGNLKTEFIGYVSDVSTGIPLKIECQDEMWKLKQTSDINMSWKDAKLIDIVNQIAPGYETEVLDMEVGAFRISNVNSAQVLEGLKKKYGLKSFFRRGKLYVGFAYPLGIYKTVKYHFQQNVTEEGNKLQYRSKDDIKLKVKATSMLPDGKKPLVYEFGDSDGALRTLHYYNLSQKELELAAERDFDDLKFQGFRGTFRAFGVPAISHGDIAQLQDDLYPDHNGGYFADKVTTSFGVGIGIKRVIDLGKQATLSQIEDSNE